LEDDLTKQAGLWIDHRNAVVVTVVDGVETTAVIESDVRQRNEAASGPNGDSQDRRFHGQLDHYYDRVIATLHGAESILILGPGEAKGELKKRIEKTDHVAHTGHAERKIAVETADKMSHREIEARVRTSFSGLTIAAESATTTGRTA
jgi:hypothetical protein